MKSLSEDSRPHPKVGVVIVKGGSIQGVTSDTKERTLF